MFKPNREFQAGLKTDETRRRRQNNSLSLRRKDRESKLQKKRQRILNRSSNSTSITSSNNNNNNNDLNQSQMDQTPLISLTNNKPSQPAIPSIGDLPKLVRGVYQQSLATQFECVKQFRLLLSQPSNPPIEQVVDSGVVPRFIQFARNNGHPQLQYESLWALLNIASGPPECTAHTIRNNSHNVFIEILQSSPFYENKDQAMWALGNIAGDGEEFRYLLLNNGILSKILFICQSQFDQQYVTNFNNNDNIKYLPISQYICLLNTTSWTVSNLCRGSPPQTIQQLELIIQCLVILMKRVIDYRQSAILAINNIENKIDNNLNENDERLYQLNKRIYDDITECLSNLAWATSYLTSYEYLNRVNYDGMNHLMERMLSEGLLSQFITMMDAESVQLRHACSRVIGNILTGSDEHTKKCINLGVLDKYYSILTKYRMSHISGHSRERKEICWAISNITAGPISDKLLVLKCNLYPLLIDFIKNAHYDISKEALWALSNATTDGDKRIICPLIEMGLISSICSFLPKAIGIGSRNNRNNKLILVALECIENILIVGNQHLTIDEPNKYASSFEEEGCFQILEDLQSDPDLEEEIYEKCVEIITKYFDGDADPINATLDYGINDTNDDDGDDQNNQNDINHEMQNSFYRNQNNQNNTNNNGVNEGGQFGFGLNGNSGSFGF